ncbi:hypothetical protein ACFQ5M_08155 [Agrilactobacillus yilanensis]|uniref:Uncharacterized protein n=1 Tax=Agrilactobacillus yilanensis TaxID=2485997 RepID=A0ABW4J9E8_9LACO|nr:hypothetical protein [Agrilactobacillus yilanensis]
MSEIYTTLEQAKAQGELVNVYQHESDDFYTGVIAGLDQDSVVLATYNENGIKDGFVLLSLSAVTEVEVASTDLASMAFRIETVAKKDILVPDFLYRKLPFDTKRSLLDQVLALTFRERQLILIALEGHEDYYEGVIQSLSEPLVFDNFNRFDYSKSKKMSVEAGKIQVIEFGGLDLYLGKLLYEQQPKHRPLIRIEANDMLPLFLQRAMTDQLLISVQPKDVVNNFFVGYVSRVDQNSTLLSLLDMAGQFGGYVLLRFSEIASIASESDYVQTIRFYEQENRKRGLLVQPILRRPWPIKSFRLWQDTVEYAENNANLLRIRFKADRENSYLGYISDFDWKQFKFHVLDETNHLSTIQLKLEDCVEIAYNYLNSYMLEEENKS